MICDFSALVSVSHKLTWSRFKQVNNTEPHRYTITNTPEHPVNCGVIDLTNASTDFRCAWGCVMGTIIGPPLNLTMWGEIFREFLDAFNDPDNADPHYIVSRATLGCILYCNMTLVLRLSQSLRSYETFGAAPALPSAGPVDFCCDLQGVCMPCD